MKRILVLSIQHTGTFFTSATIAAAYPNRHLRVGSLYERHQKLRHKRFTNSGPIELSDFIKPEKTVDRSFFDQAVTTVLTPEEVAGKHIIIGHEHHHKPKSWLIKALTEAPAAIPIVIPVRDPILSLHSKIWREVEQHNNTAGMKEKARSSRLARWLELYHEILSIPEGHVFKFPIDAEQSKTPEGRQQLIQDLYNYCKLPFNKHAYKAAEEWKPANKTHKLIVETKKKPAPRWENFKRKYLERNLDHTTAVMGLEFETLNKDQELKELMKKVGYKDVLWW